MAFINFTQWNTKKNSYPAPNFLNYNYNYGILIAIAVSTFIILPWSNCKIFFLPLVICGFIISLLCLTLVTIILLMDSLYRPNVPQYPWNFWIDRFIPVILLIAPTIVLIIFRPFNNWFHQLSLLILIHVCILLPVFYKWASLRRWNSNFSNEPESSWKHPRLYDHIAIALIYPLLWGVYFSLFRFLRLGESVNISNYFLFKVELIVPCIFLSPLLIYWVLISLNLLSNLREYLWGETASLLYSIHNSLLSRNPYFFFAEKFFKFSHFILFFLNVRLGLYKAGSFPQRSLSFIYKYTKFMPLLIFIFVISEALIHKGFIYYSIYLLFFYPSWLGFYNCVTAYRKTPFICDVCKADFIAANWANPKYPERFWFYASDPEWNFGITFAQEPSEELLDYMTKLAEPYQWKFNKVTQDTRITDLVYRIQGVKVIDHSPTIYSIANIYTRRKWTMRLAVNYYYSQRVRWVHTLVTRGIHPATGLFLKQPWDFIAS